VLVWNAAERMEVSSRVVIYTIFLRCDLLGFHKTKPFANTAFAQASFNLWSYVHESTTGGEIEPKFLAIGLLSDNLSALANSNYFAIYSLSE